MYANRKEWPLEHVSVDLARSRSHANDCEPCDETTAGLEYIDRTITAGEYFAYLELHPQTGRIGQYAIRLLTL